MMPCVEFVEVARCTNTNVEWAGRQHDLGSDVKRQELGSERCW